MADYEVWWTNSDGGFNENSSKWHFEQTVEGVKDLSNVYAEIKGWQWEPEDRVVIRKITRRTVIESLAKTLFPNGDENG